MRIKVINKSKYQLLQYSTAASADRGLHANLDNEVMWHPMGRKAIPAGLIKEITVSYEAQIRQGKVLAIKNGIIIMNSSGTIDAGYRGESSMILLNLSEEKFVIRDGAR